LRDKIAVQPVSGEVPSDVPPAAFGRFRVLHQIGVGSLGPVFRGEDPTTHQTVAIKQLRLNLAPERAHKVVEQLRDLSRRLPQHAGLIPIVDAGLHGVDPYLVTELATGESLDVALREYGPAAIVDLLPRLQRLAEALDLAAAHRVWHGALHPRDILISGQETQLTGIGVAPILEMVGTRRPARRPYTAPEVIDGEPTSPASDQYALAAIAYEWLFGGRAPRSAESVFDAPALAGVNAEALASALMTALAPQPADRFVTTAKFVEAVQAAVIRPDAPAETAPADYVDEIKPAAASNELLLDSHRGLEAESVLHRADAVAWQGSLGTPSRSGFTSGTLVAAALAGLLTGGVGGYLFGSTRNTPDARDSPEVVVDQPLATSPATAPGREFTDAPVAATPPAPAAAPPGAPVSTPPADIARLLVRSSPAGAIVAVDGTPRGTTPLTLRDLALGTRTLVISRPGYAAIERSVTLTADRPSRSVDVQLVPIKQAPRVTRASRTPPQTTSLLVDSRPTGAAVTIDGKPSGTTPLTLDSIAPGSYTVRIELAGYRPVTQTIALKAGERGRVAASLEVGQEQE